MRAIDRRDFILGGACLGVSLAAGNLWAKPRAHPLLGVAKGSNQVAMTEAALEAIGGIGQFVLRGSSVAVLINSSFRHPGSFTNPAVALAVIRACFAAGAKRVVSIKEEDAAFWQRTETSKAFAETIASLSPGKGRVKKTFAKGKTLESIEVARDFLDSDVVINIPVAKHHDGPGYSGALKNLMGALPHSSNRFFHFGSGKEGWYEDVPHLSRCIADLNQLRVPDLAVVDATTILASNGPYGPGELKRPGQIVVGTDPVMVDAYCSPLVGRAAKDVSTTVEATTRGLGTMTIDTKLTRAVEVP